MCKCLLVYCQCRDGTVSFMYVLLLQPQSVQLAFGCEPTEWNLVYLGALSGASNSVASNVGVIGQ